MSCLDNVNSEPEASNTAKQKWSTSNGAEWKVSCDVVWEVPPVHLPEVRPDFAVAKYAKIKPQNQALLDSYINGYQRTTSLFLGRNVSNPNDLPAMNEPLGYSMTYSAMATGNGNALHRHNSMEIFVALDAPFEISYGSHGEFKTLLQPWDMVAIPAEAMHSCKNMGEDGGQILTFLCGKPAIKWASGVVAEARANGAFCDDQGILVDHAVAKSAPAKRSNSDCSWGQSRQDSIETAPSESDLTPNRLRQDSFTAKLPTISLTDETSDSECSLEQSRMDTFEGLPSETDLRESLKCRLELMGKEAPELMLEAGDLDPFVFRYVERADRSLVISSSVGTMAVQWKELVPDEVYSPEGEDDTLIIVLSGSVICQHRCYTQLDVIKQPTLLVAGPEPVTLLVTRSNLPHNLNFFFDADIGADIVHHKWSTCECAERKVECDVVWEVPPPGDTPELSPEFAVAKYSKIKPLNSALLDGHINGYQRTTSLFLGRLVSRPDDLPAMQQPFGYSMTYSAMATGNGNALHRHNSVEIFVALDAPFEISYGTCGEFKAYLQPWDVVAIPAEALHSYRNMGQDGGQILTFLCGKPSITWGNGVVADARKNGALCDDTGILFEQSTKPCQETADTLASETDLKETLQRRLELMGVDAPELVLKSGDLDPFVFRFAEQAQRSLLISGSVGTMAVHWKELGPGETYSPEGKEDKLIIVLRGSVICERRCYVQFDVIKQPTCVIAGPQSATLLVVRSCLPHNVNFCFDAEIGADIGKQNVSPCKGAEQKVESDVAHDLLPHGDMAKQRCEFAVAKYSTLKPLNSSLPGGDINELQRTTSLCLGRLASNCDNLPALKHPFGYSMSYSAMPTGNGHALHRRNSVNIFVALDAPFEIAYGSCGEFKALLQPWDVVAIPAEVVHGYKNMGQDGGQILTFCCGKPPVTGAHGLVADPCKNRSECNMTAFQRENLVSAKDPLDSLQCRQSSSLTPETWTKKPLSSSSWTPLLMGEEAPELILEAGDLDPFVYRYAEEAERSLMIKASVGTMAVHWKELAPGETYSPDGMDDVLIIVLSGSVFCQGRRFSELDVLQQPNFLAAGPQPATLLVTRSSLPHNLDFFFDADIGAEIVQHKWSNCKSAERKVECDVVWEVPPHADTPQQRPDFAVAKYSKIKPLNAALLDSYINGYQRTTSLFFGRIVSNPDDAPAFEEPLGYNMTYNAMATGNGNALHRHNSVEIFVALDAPFEIAYGSDGEFKALLQPWDVVACPAEAIHSYKNMGQDGGQILTFLCGKPSITWADGVVAEARKNGAQCDDTGILLKHSPQSGQDTAETLQRRLELQAKEAQELILEAGDLDPFVFRYEEQAERSLNLSSSVGTMAVHWKELMPGETYSPEGEDDTLIIVLSGSVISQGRHYAQLDVLRQPSFLIAGPQPATLLVTRSSLPHNLNFFFDADIVACCKNVLV